MQTLLYRQRALGDNVFHVPCRCKAAHSGDIGNVFLTVCLARAAEQRGVANTLSWRSRGNRFREPASSNKPMIRFSQVFRIQKRNLPCTSC